MTVAPLSATAVDRVVETPPAADVVIVMLVAPPCVGAYADLN